MCPNSWVHMQGSCYKFSSGALNWNAAKSACEALGSNLVIINSQTELQALTSKVSQTVWIGMHRDPKDKSRWLWVDGSRPTYTHWYKGEPNGLHEECAEMYPKVYGWKWNDGVMLRLHTPVRLWNQRYVWAYQLSFNTDLNTLALLSYKSRVLFPLATF